MCIGDILIITLLSTGRNSNWYTDMYIRLMSQLKYLFYLYTCKKFVKCYK